jgi:ABC-2 type transport system permease protein
MASIIVMLIMRFTPLARNKDRFNLISGILAMVLALAFVFGMQSLSSFSEMDLTRIIESGADAVAQITSVVFPGTSFAVGSLTAIQALERLGQVAMLLLVAVIAVVVTLQAARFLYFAGVVDVNTSVSKRKQLSRDELQTAGKSGSAFWSYCLKDIRILIRTPIFFMNNVMMNFLWPVFLVIPFLTGAADEGLDQLIALARQLLSDPSSSAAPIAIAAFFAITCFIAGSNGITESALSREGKVFYILKTLPMSWRRQILAKITVGVIFSLLGILIPLAILLIVIRPPLWLALSLLAVVPGGVLLPNFSGIIFELFWPKLNWDNEQKAVKQNMNVLYGMGASLLFAALVLVPVFAFKLSVTTTVIAAAAGSLFLSLLVYRIIVRILPVRMALIEP